MQIAHVVSAQLVSYDSAAVEARGDCLIVQ